MTQASADAAKQQCGTTLRVADHDAERRATIAAQPLSSRREFLWQCGGGLAGLALSEPELVRAPRGYAADHPRLGLLRCKSLTVTRRHALGAWLHHPKAGRTIRDELDAARPLVRWVREHAGPSQHGYGRSG